MSQTQHDYNEIFFGVKGEPARVKDEVITGAADMLAGSIIVADGAGKYKAAADADKIGAAQLFPGWRILLEAAAVSGGDVTRKTGVSGGCFADKIIAVTGLTYDDTVLEKLAMNNIYVQNGTNTMKIAGEGV